MPIRSDVTDREGARPISRLAGSIEFRDVSFEYQPGRPVLSHVNPAIAPGEKVAFVGVTEAGKSTLSTSNLDSASEQIVVDALERAAAGRITLLIPHRLSTALLADRILVLDRGRIVEEGAHAEPMARNGKYAQFYNLQMMTRAESILLPLDDDTAVEGARRESDI